MGGSLPAVSRQPGACGPLLCSCMHCGATNACKGLGLLTCGAERQLGQLQPPHSHIRLTSYETATNPPELNCSTASGLPTSVGSSRRSTEQ